MIYLYVATRVLTFPGTVLRSFWEHLACRLCSIPVEDVRPFKVSEMCGHVEHELINKKAHSFFMCFTPFFLNFVLSCCFFLGASYRIAYIGDVKSIISWLFMWMGISLAANCVPSFEDVLVFKDLFYNKDTNIVAKIIFAPFFIIIYGFGILERCSITFVLAILFAVVFPQIFNLLFPVFNFFLQMV